MNIETRDNILGTMAFVAFLMALPAMYLAPVILNAIVDLVTR